ncbi:O-antigen ligase family protein [Candidatus Daviesbacteria bacterium]|nr:O-antigen ligase family protein [Candidatus Daviesbacteria bacterium]
MNLTKFYHILEKTIFYLTLFLFIFIPLYPKFPLLSIPGTYVAVRLEDVLIALAIILWTGYIGIKKAWSFFAKDNIGRAFLLFFSIGGLSLFSAIFLTHSVEPHLGILHLLRRMEFMLLLPIVATIFTTKKRLILVLVILFLTTFAVNIYGLGQQYLDLPVISTTNSEFAKGLILRLTPGARLNSTFAGHYDLAVFLASALVVFTALFFAASRVWKILILAISALSLFILVLTAARVSFIAAFIGILFALIFSKKKKYLILIFISLALVLLYPSQLRDRLKGSVTVNLLNLGQRYEGRNLNQQLESKLNIPTLPYKMASRSALATPFASAEAGLPVDITPGEPINEVDLAVYRSFQIRLNIEWPRAVNAFLKNPFLGTGYASLGIATDNDFLRSLGEVGILGTAAFFLILLSIWKKIYQGIRNEDKLIRYFCAGTLALIGVFLLNGLFIDVFEASKIASLFWMILGLNLGILNLKK